MKSLFLEPGRHAEWQALLKAGEPTALAVRDTLRRRAASGSETASGRDAPPSAGIDQALDRLCFAWLEEDTVLSESARADLCAELDAGPPSDLGKAARALAAVQAWDYGYDLWGSGERKAFADRLEAIARSFLDVTPGNPHVVVNNWWMLTHGGCLLAAMGADGEQGQGGPIDLADLKAWALERFKAFCALFGNAGLYHEGSGYIGYTLSMLMPALVAVRRHLDPGILDEFPQLRRSLPGILTGTVAAWNTEAGQEKPSFGTSLQWNDAGRGTLPLNPFIPAIHVAPGAWQGALRTLFDRITGIEGGREWESRYSGMGLLVALYPFSIPPADPQSILPRHVWDHRQGLGLWRSEWGDGSESVLGWYARSTHPGGHSQDDAASVRLISLGRTWICGGGQARGRSEWQSVFTHAHPEDRPKPAPLAHIFCSRVRDTHGVVGIDTRKSLSAYSERYLAWNTRLGLPLTLALLDLLDDHRDPPLSWQWNLSFPRELAYAVHGDGAGFSLTDPERGTLEGRFLIDKPAELNIREMPGSSRTFANGTTVDYPGDRFVHAAYPDQAMARILVALTIVPTDQESPPLAFSENAIHVGDTAWERPFAPAVLPGVDLRQSVPNRMTLPAG